MIRQVARDLVAGFADQGEADPVADFAVPLPITVITVITVIFGIEAPVAHVKR
ncbi:hypothetical protein GCM10011609_35140 [Lentzea pudingi]|uniref:Uncharacterized protein n=1 Tax=Lentzea pudingi TaxID=1789439 RepID=A0ABQ2HZW5_9PSEU|nr:hypothetical protein [Lentzea pudingi]GGM94626.1 hypothetical protein GCM10011609_35140 [Lentzea pudingi]